MDSPIFRPTVFDAALGRWVAPPPYTVEEEPRKAWPLVGDIYTYVVREEFEALAPWWDPDDHQWRVAPEHLEQARTIAARSMAQFPVKPERPLVRDNSAAWSGELWQECRRRGCDRDPVCPACELCAEHCHCPGMLPISEEPYGGDP